MLRLRAIAYPLRPFHVTSHHSPLQLVIRTVLPAGMVVMISESVPGPLRRLTVAVTAADLGRLARAGACVAGLSGGAASVRSCPAAGGSCCACPGVATAVATTMLDATLSVLNWKGMKILLADKRPAPGQCQETPCNPISVTNLRPIRGDEGLCIAISRAAAIRLLPGDDRIERRKVNGLVFCGPGRFLRRRRRAWCSSACFPRASIPPRR